MRKFRNSFLSDLEVNKIRAESIKILADIGVKVCHDEAKKMLGRAGAKINLHTDLVCIPVELTEECIQRVPHKVVLAGRNPDRDIIIQSGNDATYSRNCSGCEMYLDPYDGKYRNILASDVKEWALLVDALENIHMCAPPYHSDQDINLQARDVLALKILLENTTKHIVMQPYSPRNLEFCIELALAEVGSEEKLKERPRFSAHISPIPFLLYSENSISMMILAAKHGIPVSLCTTPICGASSPVTLAGGILTAVAEHLAAVVILQTIYPGTPLIFAPRPLPLNMTTGTIIAGSVEGAMMEASLTRIAKDGWGWPIDVMGAPTDSFIPDAQCAIEKSFALNFATSAHADIISGLGNFEAGLSLSPAQLVIDTQLFGMALRAARGIEVSDDTLGIDAIKRVGIDAEKSFLSDDHTLKYFRDEYFGPLLFTRCSREKWESQGKKTLYKIAREAAISIIKEHKPSPLEERILNEMNAISENAEKSIGNLATAL